MVRKRRYSNKAVAAQLGFATDAHFCREFKKHFGASPQTFASTKIVEKQQVARDRKFSAIPGQHVMMQLITPLADNPEAVSLLARWFHGEWHIFDGRSVPTIEAQLAENLCRDSIPITFLAKCRSEVVGTVSLDLSDLAPFDHLSPWLASLYVLPAARGTGIGTALMYHAQQFATSHGIARLYLWTPGATRLYEKCGWEVSQRTEYNSHPITLMHF
jgi:GNAT superfamily N-acetyltransferase